MGREIRRVPKGWEHPQDKGGEYVPLYDANYEDAARQWLADLDLWRAGRHPAQLEHAAKHPGEPYPYSRYYWEYRQPPDSEAYRTGRYRYSAAEAVCCQVYETVSEGTPVSPVFDSLDALTDWLVAQGYSRPAAEAFAREGWASSMVLTSGARSPLMDIHALGD